VQGFVTPASGRALNDTMTPRQLLSKLFPPMLATLASDPPTDDRGWTYELKYDGFRAVCALTGGAAAMLSRNELDLAPRFPRVFENLQKIKAKDVVLDAEIVVLDEHDVPRFQLLQQGSGRERLIVFDILWLDGEDLRRKPYLERRKILQKTLSRPPVGVYLAETLNMTGAEALRQAAEGGWEGIIAKRNTSVYEPRRSKEWLKLKALHEQEFAIVGWQPSTANERDIGSLHLAVREGKVFRYAGKVGTGFSAKLRAAMRAVLEKDEISKPAVVDAPRARDAHWVTPRLVAQVAFTEWTTDHRLRHPAFLGLREDKSVDEVVREEPLMTGRITTGTITNPKVSKKAAAGSSKSAAKVASKKAGKAPASAKPTASASSKTSVPSKTAAKSKTSAKSRTSSKSTNADGPSRVTLTSPDRVLYPNDGITKQDVADYFEAMAEPMLRALAGRPLALEHWNQGIHKGSWFHQNISREGPDWLTVVETPTRTVSRSSVKHLVVDSVDALRWLAQMSALTIHMWSSREGTLEEPDWLVFDLDPAKGKGIEQAIEAAIVMRGLLENLELPSVPKTSGKRGIHVLVPLAPGYSHEEVADFACSVAAAVTAHVPDMTVERSLAKRRGRLYLDCMQNGYGKTIVAPYSLRAIDGAPVSAPLKWSEITRRLDPLKYNLRTMPARYAKVGDLFADVFSKGVKLPKLKE
jgi:bifunctional non-homologous end joining protein LigD